MINRKISISTYLDIIENNKLQDGFLNPTVNSILNNNNNLNDIDCINKTNTLEEDIKILSQKQFYNYHNKNKDELSKIHKTNNYLMCTKHKLNFEYYCLICHENICKECKEHHIYNYHPLVNLNELDDIYSKKIEQLINYKNNNKFDNLSNFNNKIDDIKEFKMDDIYLEQSLAEKGRDFNILINIIINDYINYPNYTHFLNIENILHFLNIKDKSEYKENKDNNESNEIIIKYIKNNNGKTKLFSKKFVENNKEKVNLEIDGKIFKLKKEYIFKKNII